MLKRQNGIPVQEKQLLELWEVLVFAKPSHKSTTINKKPTKKHLASSFPLAIRPEQLSQACYQSFDITISSIL